MNEFEAMGYSQEQSEALIKAKEKFGLPTEALLKAIRSFENVFRVFTDVFSRFIGICSKVNVNENYLHNVHVAKYSKKKRVRKKYTKKLIK